MSALLSEVLIISCRSKFLFVWNFQEKSGHYYCQTQAYLCNLWMDFDYFEEQLNVFGSFTLNSCLCFGVLIVMVRCACVLSRFSCVWLFSTLWSVAHQASLSIGIFQARILEWVAVLSFRESSWPRIRTYPTSLMFPALAGEFFTTSATWEGPIMMTKAGQMLLRDERWCLMLFSLLVPPPPPFYYYGKEL